jgi:hypothetical protein
MQKDNFMHYCMQIRSLRKIPQASSGIRKDVSLANFDTKSANGCQNQDSSKAPQISETKPVLSHRQPK